MHVVEATREIAKGDYLMLFHRCKAGHWPVPGFTQSMNALVSKQPIYLKKHFSQRLFFLRDVNENVAAVIAFIPKTSGPLSLGGFLAVADLDFHLFHGLLSHATEAVGGKFLMPLNGHPNYGISAVNPKVPSEKITILTSGHSRGHEALFTYPKVKIEKKYLSLITRLTPDRVSSLKSEISKMPAGFTTRQFNMLRFKRDIGIHGELVNRTMNDLDLFEPMTISENWSLMAGSLPLISPRLFQFLMYDGQEIGFCFAMLDFNQIIGRSGDVTATLKALTSRGQILRGRILSTGILPEFRGQNLIKFARNKVLLGFAEMGIETVESSYVDEKNVNSIGNVTSKGGEISHEFSVFRTL